MDMNLGKLWEMVRDGEAWCAVSMGWQRVRHNWVTEQEEGGFNKVAIYTQDSQFWEIREHKCPDPTLSPLDHKPVHPSSARS